MKFTVNGYEIDIKARRIDEKEDCLFNDEDTRDVCIDMACYLNAASEYYEEYGYMMLSKGASAYGDAFRDTYQKYDRDMKILNSVDAGRRKQ